MRELRETVINLYGPRSASTTDEHNEPSPEVMRDLRETVISLYGSAAARPVSLGLAAP